MVRQLLTVTRLESGALKPRSEVVALSTRVRKAWEALGVDDVAFELDDDADRWLAIADADQLDQVLWALLDNAVKYGAAPDPGIRRRRHGGAPAPGHDRRRRSGRHPDGRGPAVRPVRARRGVGSRRRQRAGAVRVARAVSRDERRPAARTAGARSWGGVHDRPPRRASRGGVGPASGGRGARSHRTSGRGGVCKVACKVRVCIIAARPLDTRRVTAGDPYDVFRPASAAARSAAICRNPPSL